MMRGMQVQNSPLWEIFKKSHREDVKCIAPNSLPTVGRHNHDVEATEFFKTFDKQNATIIPIKSCFGDGRLHLHCCGLDSNHERFHEGNGWKNDTAHGESREKIQFCTVATWKNGEMNRRKIVL